MAEGSFRELIVTFILIAVFIIALANVAIRIGTDNDSSISILDNPVLNNTFSELQTDLSNAESDVNSSKTSFESEKTNIEFGELTFKSIVGSGKKFTGILFGILNLIFRLIFSVIGLIIVLGAIIIIVTINVILRLWRLYKQGE